MLNKIRLPTLALPSSFCLRSLFAHNRHTPAPALEHSPMHVRNWEGRLGCVGCVKPEYSTVLVKGATSAIPLFLSTSGDASLTFLKGLQLCCCFCCLLFQRHKLSKNQFIPSCLKNIHVTGAFGQRVSMACGGTDTF